MAIGWVQHTFPILLFLSHCKFLLKGSYELDFGILFGSSFCYIQENVFDISELVCSKFAAVIDVFVIHIFMPHLLFQGICKSEGYFKSEGVKCISSQYMFTLSSLFKAFYDITIGYSESSNVVESCIFTFFFP